MAPRAGPDEFPIFGKAVGRAIASLAPDLGSLEAVEALRRVLPPDRARAAAELRELRVRAAARFPDAERMFFTRKGLEQATGPRVAAWRAARLLESAEAGATVLDATAGIGSDAIALARAGLLAVASDRDPLTAACARANLEVLGLPPRVVVADAARPAARADFLLLDPDRRAGGKSGRRRNLDPAAWSPGWGLCAELAARFAGACLELAPAADPDRLPLPPDLARAWEWVSRDGELAELCLWTGALAPGADPRRRRVTALLADGGEARLEGIPEPVPALEPDAAAAVRWLAEPDPAVIRSGLIGNLARTAGLAPVGPGIAYLGGDQPPDSPLLRAWRVRGSAPADRRRVRRLLAEHDVGPIDVARRGHPESPERLERLFRGPGARRGRLIVARLARGHRAWLVESLAGAIRAEGDPN